MKLNQKSPVMDLIEAKAGVSRDPVAMVPAPSSQPDFFMNTATSPLHQPLPSSAKLLVANADVSVDQIGKLPVNHKHRPVMMVRVVAGWRIHILHLFGGN